MKTISTVNGVQQALSQDFLNAWNSKQGKGGKTVVQYKRRYWNGSAFVYEANWTQISMHGFVKVGEIVTKLDTPLLNEIKSSTVTLQLKNLNWDWVPSNLNGVFGPSASVPAGYEPFLTQFQILFGYQVPQGSEIANVAPVFELVTIFTGVLIDLVHTSKDGFSEATINGNDYLMQMCDAQLVSFPLSSPSETVVTGVNDAIDIYTAIPGVPHSGTYHSAVLAAGTYTMAQLAAAFQTALNSMGTGLTFSAVVSAANGSPCINLSYYAGLPIPSKTVLIQWNSGAHSSTCCAVLFGCTTSGDSSMTGLYQIANPYVNFYPPGQPTTSIGSNQYKTSVTSPPPSAPLPSPFQATIVTETGVGISAANFAVYDSGRTVAAGYPNGNLLSQGTDYTIDNQNTYGEPITIQLNYTALGTITYTARQWYILSDFTDLVYLLCYQAGFTQSQLNISPVVFGSGSVVTTIGEFSGSNYSPPWTVIESASQGPGVFASNGAITGGAYSGSAGGNSIWSCPSTPAYGIWVWDMAMACASNVPGFITAANIVQFISDSASGGNGYYLVFARDAVSGGSGAISCSLVSTAAGTLASAYAPAGLGGDFQLNASGGPHTWTISRGTDGLFQVFCDGLFILSATDNNFTTSSYWVMRSLFGTIDEPYQVTYAQTYTITNTLATVTTMADFSNLTVYEAIQELAKLANYEFGFDGYGNFFFRPKNPVVTTAVANLSDGDGVSKITEFRSGWDSIINDAQVTVSTFYREYNSQTVPESQPTSQQRYLTQILQEDYSDFPLAYDPVIAQSRAQNLHDSYSQPMRHVKVESKIIPFTDLSDILSLSFYGTPLKIGPYVAGDPLRKVGQAGSEMTDTPTDILCRALPGKLIGMTLNLNDCTGLYEIQENL